MPKSDPGRAYPCVRLAGFWPIGYGHPYNPKHPPITEAEGESDLAQALTIALNATLRYCPVLTTEPEEQPTAVVDFTFNFGAGWL